LRGEVRLERDEIAALRAEWSQLDNPERIETLAKRYLKLKPIVPTQFDPLDRLPDRPPPPPEQEHVDARDPIGGMIDGLEEPTTTGSIPAPAPSSGTLPPANGAPYPISGAQYR